jgi:hypothetical protein
LYIARPSGCPKGIRIAMDGKADRHVIRRLFAVLSRILLQFFNATFSERFGIMTTDSALVRVKGKKSSGITIPETIPNVAMASLEDIPLTINLCGMRIEFAAIITDETNRVKVTGAAIAIIFFSKNDVDTVALLL